VDYQTGAGHSAQLRETGLAVRDPNQCLSSVLGTDVDNSKDPCSPVEKAMSVPTNRPDIVGGSGTGGV
jgi:hypothetical protein